MNDWLDYKGSGSSRAYMGETIQHNWTTGTPYVSPDLHRKQKDAEMRLLDAKKEQLEALKIDMRNADLNAQAAAKRIIEKEKLKKTYEEKLSKVQSEYKAIRADKPLEAHQKFSESEWAYKEYIKAMDDKIAKEKAAWSKYSNSHSELKSKVLKVQQEISNLEKSLKGYVPYLTNKRS